jgi:hypothetical protein
MQISRYQPLFTGLKSDKTPTPFSVAPQDSVEKSSEPDPIMSDPLFDELPFERQSESMKNTWEGKYWRARAFVNILMAPGKDWHDKKKQLKEKIADPYRGLEELSPEQSRRIIRQLLEVAPDSAFNAMDNIRAGGKAETTAYCIWTWVRAVNRIADAPSRFGYYNSDG